MELSKALEIAERVKKQLAPFCDRIEIAGSIRRCKPHVKDIEIVAIPKPYSIGLFEDGIASVVNKWEKVKGELDYLTCKYIQCKLTDGIKLDLFFAKPDNWGLILAIRTGSAEFSHQILAQGWVKKGYRSRDGYLWMYDKKYPIYEEKELFSRIGVDYVEPEKREI